MIAHGAIIMSNNNGKGLSSIPLRSQTVRVSVFERCRRLRSPTMEESGFCDPCSPRFWWWRAHSTIPCSKISVVHDPHRTAKPSGVNARLIFTFFWLEPQSLVEPRFQKPMTSYDNVLGNCGNARIIQGSFEFFEVRRGHFLIPVSK